MCDVVVIFGLGCDGVDWMCVGVCYCGVECCEVGEVFEVVVGWEDDVYLFGVCCFENVVCICLE